MKNQINYIYIVGFNCAVCRELSYKLTGRTLNTCNNPINKMSEIIWSCDVDY